jgi:hypothetical protein
MLLPYKDRNVQVTQSAFWGSSERFLGLLATALSRWEAATAHYESAIAKNEAGGNAGAASLVRRDYAAMLMTRGAPGDLDHAEALLRETLTSAEAAQMAGVIAHIREKLDEIERQRSGAAARAKPAPPARTR